MVKKADIILFVFILLLSLALFLSLFFMPKDGGKTLVVTVDGKEYCKVPLSSNTEIVLPENTIEIKDGKAYMKAADCPDKVCINQGKIENVGETVVCLPAGVILEVE